MIINQPLQEILTVCIVTNYQRRQVPIGSARIWLMVKTRGQSRPSVPMSQRVKYWRKEPTWLQKQNTILKDTSLTVSRCLMSRGNTWLCKSKVVIASIKLLLSHSISSQTLIWIKETRPRRIRRIRISMHISHKCGRISTRLKKSLANWVIWTGLPRTRGPYIRGKHRKRLLRC